ncbi:MAG: hypothetical protein JJD93_08765 [Ilumatobacteraceae bacterium]|nr:hypothetical protein [Ilumatobacteraceae bacterium]
MTVPSFGHVLSMTDGIGIFEHADHAEPRRGHGYCTDDVARLLIVVVREPERSQAVRELGRIAFRFLASSQGASGRTRNRRTVGGRWQGRRGVEDCWGRSVWAFGSAARRAPEDGMRSSGLSYFNHGLKQRSPHRRAMAFAALGAAEVLTADLRHRRARDLLADAITSIGPLSTDHRWPWPEPRLSYANAALPEALIAAGHLLDRPDVLEDGLILLRWLLDRETVDGHLSPTPVGGAGPDDHAPLFDQQPIEVAALADACARAQAVTGDDEWRRGVDLAIRWFAGDNDRGAVMWDRETSGGYDGLTPSGPNLNQGAESTLALISTMQHSLPRTSGTGSPAVGPVWSVG